jgi:hypothetical protein
VGVLYYKVTIFDVILMSDFWLRWPRNLRRWSWPLGCRDQGCKSCSGRGCLSLCLYVVLSFVSRGLCDRLITRPKESYHKSRDIKKPTEGRPGHAWAVEAADDDGCQISTCVSSLL